MGIALPLQLVKGGGGGGGVDIRCIPLFARE